MTEKEQRLQAKIDHKKSLDAARAEYNAAMAALEPQVTDSPSQKVEKKTERMRLRVEYMARFGH